MSKLLPLYENLLKFAGLTVNDEGYVFVVINDKKEPFTVDGKQVVLPTKEHLKNSINKCIFHPLRENLMDGESEMIKAYRNALAIRFNIVITTIGQYLLNVAASSSMQQKLASDQLDLITSLGDVDSKTLENFIKVSVAGMKLNAHKNFVSLFLKRGDTLLGKRYARVSIVTFPVYEQLVKQAEKVNGVKIRVKDYETLTKLYQFILPGVTDQHSYSAGSNSRVAPFMEALMGSAMKLAGDLNEMLKRYGDFIDDADLLIFNSDWIETFEDMDGLNNEIIRIPSQFGNKSHSVFENEEIEAPAAPAPTPVVQPQPQSMPQPMMPQQPMGYPQPMMPAPMPVPAMRDDGKVSMRDLLNKVPNSQAAPNPMAAFAQAQQPMMPMGYPQPMMPQPMGYPQPMMPQQPMMQQPMGYPQPMMPQPMGYPPGMMPQQPMGYPQQVPYGMVPNILNQPAMRN